jgi:hypothetical protein
MATRRKRAVSDKVKKAQSTPSFQLLAPNTGSQAGELFAIEAEWLRICEEPAPVRKTG